MTANNKDFSELNRKNMEAAMRLAQLSIENSQRVLALQNELARELFSSGVDNARAQSAANDPNEILRLRAQYAQDTAQKMMLTAQHVAEIGNEARVTFSRMLTEQLAAGSQEMADAFQGYFKTMPGQNANMLEVMQQAMSSANSAFEQMAKATTATIANMGANVVEAAQKNAGHKK